MEDILILEESEIWVTLLSPPRKKTNDTNTEALLKQTVVGLVLSEVT